MTILKEIPPIKAKAPRFAWVLCHCGNLFITRALYIRSGHTKSCGCLHWELIRRARTKHGEADHRHGRVTPEYRAWSKIIERTNDPNNKDWPRYGGRGISVCPEWRNDYHAFLAYVGRRPSSEYSIDRYPNPDGNYEPGNVRWATIYEQRHNRGSKKELPAISDGPK